MTTKFEKIFGITEKDFYVVGEYVTAKNNLINEDGDFFTAGEKYLITKSDSFEIAVIDNNKKRHYLSYDYIKTKQLF